MNHKETMDLAAQVRKDDPQIRILGFPFYGRNSYEIACVDTRSGYPFVVRGWDDWNERKWAAEDV